MGGCGGWAEMVSIKMVRRKRVGGWAHLDDGEAQNGRGDIANPHACKHCNKHVGEQYGSWSGACLAENECRHPFGNIVL
jgi:hypothetical protein